METSPYSCVFWSKDESDADLTEMAQGSAHVPGVTDTALSRKKTAQLHFTSVHNKQKLNLHQGHKKKEMQSSMTSENRPKKENMRGGATGERPSLKDLRPEDKKRVANLIRELAKTGEEKEVAKEQLEVERKENEMKTKKLQKQIEAILSERETIQQQYLECQKLLSSYQAKVSEEQRNLSGSIHDGSSTQKAHKQNGGRSPVEERARTISPTSERYASKRDQEFMELQSVPVPSSEDVSRRNGGEFIDPHEPSQGRSISSGQQSHSSHHDITSGQFNPVLSSTHRPHHRSRVPPFGAKDTRTAPSENRVNGVSSTHRHEQSMPRDSRGLPKAHSVQRDGSRTSQETFLPLTEVTDDSASAHVRTATSKGRESRKSSDRNSWVSLPEMDGQVPSSYELHQREQGQNESYLNGSQPHSRSFSTPGARFSKQRLHFEDAASFQYGDDFQTGIQAHRQENARSNGPRTPGYDVETWQHRRDYRNLTPEQRQQQLGSLKKRLQQEQGWLQQKLQEQEQLLLHKRLEIQRQKEELSQIGESGYEQVRRKYLGEEKPGEQYRTRTRTSDEYGTGYSAVNHGIHEDGYHHQRLLPEGGQNEVVSPWRRNVPLEEEDLISTNYPPDDFQEGYRRGITGSRARDRFDHYRQRHVGGYDEDVDLHHRDDDDDGDGDEMDGDDETWYKMREETEGADNMGSIQGYVSLHPHQDRRQGVIHKSAAPDTATFYPYQSYPTSGLKDAVNGVDVRSNRDFQSRISEPQRQFGSISALLEEEHLAGLSLNGPNPLYTRPGPVPRPGTVTTPTLRAGNQPYPSHSRHQEARNAHSASLDRLRERDKVTMDLYTPQSGQGKKQRVRPNPSAGRDVSYPSSSKRTDEGHVYSYTDPAKDDALHAHLVQRSHQVIQEIGMLLDQSAEIGEQEESKVLEDVFFLK